MKKGDKLFLGEKLGTLPIFRKGVGYFWGFTGLYVSFGFFGLKAKLSSIDNHPKIGERSR